MAPRRGDELADVVSATLAANPELRAEAEAHLSETMRLVFGYVRQQFGPLGTPSTKLAITKTLLPALLKGQQSEQGSAKDAEKREALDRVLKALREG